MAEIFIPKGEVLDRYGRVIGTFKDLRINVEEKSADCAEIAPVDPSQDRVGSIEIPFRLEPNDD